MAACRLLAPVSNARAAATGQTYNKPLPAQCDHLGLPVLHVHLAPLLLLQGAAVLGVQDGGIGATQGQLVLQLAGRPVDVQWVISKLLQMRGECHLSRSLPELAVNILQVSDS